MAKPKSAPSTPAAGPRAEARSFAYENLSEQQKDVFDRALELVHAIAAKKTERVEENKAGFAIFLPKVEEPRANHVILIDGERGSGKTSVLLSLLHLWNNAAQGNPPAKDERSDRIPPRRTIVPVGLLDLEPLPESTSLMLHLTGCLHRVVEAMGEESGSQKQPRWEPGVEGRTTARDQWRKFVRAVAMGWDENVKKRAANIDVETYVAEIEQAERERLDVRLSFTRFMDALVEEYRVRFGDGESPLFLVAVDDADMNPGKSVQLLQLFRTLWHPRLVFVVTGDSNLFVTSLRVHYAGSLRLPGTEVLTGVNEAERMGASAMAIRLARSAYDKTIPPAQRLATGRLSPENRLKFPGVLDALKLIKIERSLHASRALRTFADYLKRPRLYSEALPGNLRNLIDLRDYLPTILRPEGTQGRAAPATRVLQRMWEIAIQDSDMSPAEGTAIRDVIEVWAERPIHQVREHLFRFDPHLSSIFPVETIHPLIRAACTVPLKWTCARLRKDDSQGFLPDSIGAILMLATDTAADAGYSSSFLEVDGARLAFGATYFGYSNDAHRAWYRFPLPIPNWHSFATFDRVAASLMNRMPSSQAEYEHDEHIRRLLQATISACHVGTTAPLGAVGSWKDLALQVGQMLDEDDVSDEGRDWAFSMAGLFGAPELGLSTKAAHEWLDGLKKACGKEWAGVCKALQEHRNERCEKAAVAGPIARSAPSVAYVSAAYYLDSWAGLLDSTLKEHLTHLDPHESSEDELMDISGEQLRSAIDHIVKKKSPHPWTEFVASV